MPWVGRLHRLSKLATIPPALCFPGCQVTTIPLTRSTTTRPDIKPKGPAWSGTADVQTQLFFLIMKSWLLQEHSKWVKNWPLRYKNIEALSANTRKASFWDGTGNKIKHPEVRRNFLESWVGDYNTNGNLLETSSAKRFDTKHHHEGSTSEILRAEFTE